VAHALGDEHADWGVELVDAWLQRHGGPDGDEGASELRARAEGAGELARAGAKAAPAELLARLLPYMQRVMATTEVNPARLPIADRHFSSRGWDSDRYHLDETLVFCAAAALHVERCLISGRGRVLALFIAGIVPAGLAGFARS
jgi:hypothetical protein